MSYSRIHVALIAMVIASVLGGCAPAGSGSRTVESPAPAGPKHLVAAIGGDPKSLGSEAGTFSRPLRGLLNAGLANPDERGQIRPQLAEAVPSVENGLWKVRPDGRMETTWKIRSGAQWHDGTSFTAEDVLFTAQVSQDRDLPTLRDPSFQSLQSIEALDQLTVMLTWKELFINADQVFGFPVPRHILEGAARDDKASLSQLPFWNQEFIGTGPFKLTEWIPGTHVLLDANDAYVLGRPKIDQIDVKLITNSGTLVTNLLAGAVEMSLGQTLSLDQALEVRDRWQLGHVEVVPRPGWTVIFPQLAYSKPAVVEDVRFRRALLYAIDRQEMVDTLVSGLSSVADSILPVGQPDYVDVRAQAPRYAYDPQQAMQLMQELGFTRAADGAFVDGAGQRLAIEARTQADNDNNVKALHSVVDYWQRLGLIVDGILVPSQQSDREYLATFPGFLVTRHTADETWLVNFTSSKAPTRENNWTGNNESGFRSAEYDALYDRYAKAIPRPERIQLIGELAYRLADQAVAMGLYYDNLVAFIGNRLVNVVVPQYYGAQFVWSAHLWDVQS